MPGPTPTEFAIRCKVTSLSIVFLFASVLLILRAQIVFLISAFTTRLTQPFPAIDILPIFVRPTENMEFIPSEYISFKRLEYSVSLKCGYEIIVESFEEFIPILSENTGIRGDKLVDCILY